MLQPLLWDTLRANHSTHCAGHSHALKMGTVSTCLFPMFGCKSGTLPVSGETPAVALANSTIHIHGTYSINNTAVFQEILRQHILSGKI